MRIIICKDKRTQGEAVASLFAAQILRKPESVIGLATGSTPIPAYEALVDLYGRGIVDFSAVRSFNLDEYVALPQEHPESYHSFMWSNLLSKVNIRTENVHILDGNAADPVAECAAYENAIRDAGGIDLQLLGIGHNGHIGFDEPAGAFAKDTHLENLSARTIEANARFFASAEEVPRQALTMGIGTIMRARGVVLMISGADKADIAKAALQGPVVPSVPASILQFHADVVAVLDEAAAAKL